MTRAAIFGLTQPLTLVGTPLRDDTARYLVNDITEERTLRAEWVDEDGHAWPDAHAIILTPAPTTDRPALPAERSAIERALTALGLSISDVGSGPGGWDLHAATQTATLDLHRHGDTPPVFDARCTPAGQRASSWAVTASDAAALPHVTYRMQCEATLTTSAAHEVHMDVDGNVVALRFPDGTHLQAWVAFEAAGGRVSEDGENLPPGARLSLLGPGGAMEHDRHTLERADPLW